MVLNKKSVRYNTRIVPYGSSISLDNHEFLFSALPLLQHNKSTITGAWDIAEYLEDHFPAKSLTKNGFLNYRDVVNKLSNLYATVETCILNHQPVSFVDKSDDSVVLHSMNQDATTTTTTTTTTASNTDLISAVNIELDAIDSILQSTPGQYLCGPDMTLADLFMIPRLFNACVGLDHFLKLDILRVKSAATAKRPALEAYLSYMFNKQMFNEKRVYIHADAIIAGWKTRIAKVKGETDTAAAQ